MDYDLFIVVWKSLDKYVRLPFCMESLNKYRLLNDLPVWMEDRDDTGAYIKISNAYICCHVCRDRN